MPRSYCMCDFEFSNTLWPWDAIGHQEFWSTLVQTTASHHLNQCWLTLGDVLLHSPQSNIHLNIRDFNSQAVFEIDTFEISVQNDDVIMGAMESQITSLTIVYSTVYSDRSKKTSKLRVTGLCVGNSPGTGEFPAQMASNAENVSNWWRHHGTELSRSNEMCLQITSLLHREMFRLTRCLSGNLWYLQQNCIGDTIVYHKDSEINPLSWKTRTYIFIVNAMAAYGLAPQGTSASIVTTMT